MAEVVHNTTDEFWKPPIAATPSGAAILGGACGTCRAEFMVGAQFCHVCGANRLASGVANWTRRFEFLRALEFQSVQQWLGLPIPSLVAFFAGLGCILAAILVGVIYSAQNLADFQAIQLWRLQWLVGALVAFVAGILLKKSGNSSR